MEILITERTDITPLLGMDWMKKFKLTISRIQLAENNQSEREKVFNKFPDLFENNETVKDTEMNIQLKPGHYTVKQKARPIPLHLQENVGRELEKLIKSGHLEKINDVDEDCFVSPVVITVKSDKSVKIALDSRKLNDSCIKMRPHYQFGRITEPNIGGNNTRQNSKTFHIQNRLGLRIRPNETIRRNKPTLRIRITGGKTADITGSKKGFTDLPTYPQYSKKKLTEHLNTAHRHGWTI